MEPDLFTTYYIENLMTTSEIAARLAGLLNPGDVIAFQGDLGAGKTTFIQFLCSSLGVKEQVTSPTFTIINEYYSAKHFHVYHFDFYRLKNTTELRALNFEDYLFGNGLCLIEWSEKISEFLPDRYYCIHIWFDSQNRRMMKIEKKDER